MEIVRVILVVALLTTVLGVIFEFIVPASGRLIDAGAALFALATWIAPLMLLAMSWNKKTGSSLAGVGFAIRIVVVAACLSVIGVSLALVTLVFARGGHWAWLALMVIAAFWLAGVLWISITGRNSRRAGGRDT